MKHYNSNNYISSTRARIWVRARPRAEARNPTCASPRARAEARARAPTRPRARAPKRLGLGFRLELALLGFKPEIGLERAQISIGRCQKSFHISPDAFPSEPETKKTRDQRRPETRGEPRPKETRDPRRSQTRSGNDIQESSKQTRLRQQRVEPTPRRARN